MPASLSVSDAVNVPNLIQTLSDPSLSIFYGGQLWRLVSFREKSTFLSNSFSGLWLLSFFSILSCSIGCIIHMFHPITGPQTSLPALAPPPLILPPASCLTCIFCPTHLSGPAWSSCSPDVMQWCQSDIIMTDCIIRSKCSDGIFELRGPSSQQYYYYHTHTHTHNWTWTLFEF